METQEKIKKLIEEFLRRLGVASDSIEVHEDLGRTSFIIKSRESSLLIGSRGAHISAINHLIKRMAGKGSPEGSEPFNFYVDVNDYHETLVQEIKNKAFILAERARSFKTSVEMDPMSSYERMIIHTFFENIPDIKTESQGTGAKRRVIIKYVGD